MNVQRACTPCVLSVSHVRTMHEVRECTSSGGVFTILASLTPLFRFSPLASFKRVCNDAPLCESGKTWNAATGKAPCGACSSSASCSNGVETACTGTTNTVCKTACAGGTTWSSDGLSPCSTCTAESSCAPHGVDAACTASSDTVCTPPVPCVSGSTFSTSGKSPCQSCAAASTCPNGVKHACVPTTNTMCVLVQTPIAPWPKTVNAGSVDLPLSGATNLLVLSQINDGAPDDPISMGRSYGGAAWELSPESPMLSSSASGGFTCTSAKW